MTNGGYLSKEAILAAELAFEDVAVPEWGGTVRVREMTAAEREQFAQTYARRDKAAEEGREFSIQGALVAMCVVDANGARLFSDDEVAVLALKSGVAIDRIYDVAYKLSKIGSGATDEIAKNSVPSTSADSVSG